MSANAWEHSKENAAPLRGGRNVASFNRAVLAPQRAKSACQERDSQVLEFEKLVQATESPNYKEITEDPLEHWIAYIKYYQTAFPSDTHQQFLLTERCTRALMKIPSYHDDDRFIGICARYADKTKEPAQIFTFLHEQKVGASRSLFWIAWAYVAEKDGDFKFAEQVYKKGIRKESQPLDILKTRHKQFQRRMSRHWLNSSQANENMDDDLESTSSMQQSRHALSGLSRHSVRHNHRATHRPTTSTASLMSARDQRTNQSQSFQIFEESAPEPGNEENMLDRPLVEGSRVLETEADRRKENTLEAERWNERGGLKVESRRSRSQPGASRGPPPAFAVFVDEECAAKHQEMEKVADDQRRARDDRMFRERKDDRVVDKLKKDPLRYFKDPSRLGADIAIREAALDTSASLKTRSKPEKIRVKVGFHKSLLQAESREEQCFEEARASNIVSTSHSLKSAENFNKLMKQKEEVNDSRMDLDDDLSMDVSERGIFPSSPKRGESLVEPDSQERTEGHVLFRNDSSIFDRTVLSTISSIADEATKVGVPPKNEDETINTKFAMKELSMMFSSPAFGMDPADRKRVTQQSFAQMGSPDNDRDKSCDDFGEQMIGGCFELDNSLVRNSPVAQEQNNPTPSKRIGLSMCSESTDFTPAMQVEEEKAGLGFQIYADNPSPKGEKAATGKRTNVGSLSKTQGFEIFLDTVETSETETEKDVEHQGSSSPLGLLASSHDSDAASADDEVGETGETISMSLLGDTLAELGGTREADSIESVGGDTASLSVFQDLFSETHQATEDEFDGSENHDKILLRDRDRVGEMDPPSPKRMRQNRPENPTLDFRSHFKGSTELALQQCLQDSSSVTCRGKSASLFNLLAGKGRIFHLSNLTIPRELKKKKFPKHTRISVGKHEAFVEKKLGSGVFGVVFLLHDSDPNSDSTPLAVKMQSPTGSLALEFVNLRLLQERLLPLQGCDFPFPSPFSLLMVEDGGLMSMSSAGSETGLTLVDLSNFYRLKLDEEVPELIALHYTARMMRHVETLHCHGKILHCDVKPDQFVLSSRKCSSNPHDDIGCSDLILVDFGRSVDLLRIAEDSGNDAPEVRFVGDACSKEIMCATMRNGKSWLFDVDLFGVLSSAHVLLFGTHLELRESTAGTGRWEQRLAFKRYWKKSIWEKLFQYVLTNEGPGFPDGIKARSLRPLRVEIENLLAAQKRNLRAQLERQFSLLPSSRDGISR